MEQNDDIAYKAWVENLQEPAPEGAWNAIADQLDIDAAWDGISESLDIDDVWHNIETELPQAVPVSNPSAPTHLPKLFWVAAALVLLTLTTPLTEERAGEQPAVQNITQSYVEDKSAEQREEKINPGTVDTPETKNAKQSGTKQVVQPEEKNSQALATPVEKSDRNTIQRKTSAANNRQEPGKSNTDQRILSEIPSQAVFGPVSMSDSTRQQAEGKAVSESVTKQSTTQTPEMVTDTLNVVAKQIETDSIILVADTGAKIDTVERTSDRATWHVGIIGSLKNTWLINPETANGLKEASLNDTRVTFGKEFGVTVQRSLGGMSDLQFEYYFYSEIGQRYHEYINALYQTKDIRLRYQKFQVLYRTRIFRKINGPALYATGGIRVSRLTLADTSIGNESEEVTQEYRPWDYGFILGTEAEFKLSDKLVLVSGLRGSYGLRNIYLGTSQAPAEFNKTHTASVGLMLGLKYRIN